MSTENFIQQAKYADDVTKRLISGYIRLLFKNIVPDLIVHITICYYYMMDEFDLNLHGNGFQIKGEIAKKIQSGYQSAYLTRICESSKHHWKFKILKYGGSSNIEFGIWDCNSTKKYRGYINL